MYHAVHPFRSAQGIFLVRALFEIGSRIMAATFVTVKKKARGRGGEITLAKAVHPFKIGFASSFPFFFDPMLKDTLLFERLLGKRQSAQPSGGELIFCLGTRNY